MSYYLKTMRKLVNNLAFASHPVTLDDLVSQILIGLDSSEYNPVVCQITKNENITWLVLQSKLLSFEKRLEQMNAGIASINLSQPSTNFVNTKGGSSYNNHGKGQNH